MRQAARRRFLAGAGVAALNSLTPWTARGVSPYEPVGYLRTNWSQDPWALGSYSFIAKAASPQDHVALTEPLAGRIYLAGEASHAAYNSTVHAAHESGLRAAQEVSDAGHRRIAVIGAGMAGMTAARHLTDAGLEVVVYEARDRIGGRIWTEQRFGYAFDLGASWIHGTEGNPLVELARLADAQIVQTDDSHVARGRDGREIGWLETPGWLSEVSEAYNTVGAAAAEVNVGAYAERTEDYDGPDVIFPGGYADLIDVLAGGFETRLSTPVRRISYARDGVAVDGVPFDAAVVTLPLGVLKAGHVTFDPPLPKPQQEAIARLGVGVLDKLYLGFDEVFWDEDVTWISTPETGLPRGHFNTWLNLAPYLEAPIVMAFSGGPAAQALAELDDTEIVQQALDVLSLAYPA